MIIYGHFNEMSDGSGPLTCIRIDDQQNMTVDRKPKIFDSIETAQIYCDMHGIILDNEKWKDAYNKFSTLNKLNISRMFQKVRQWYC